MKSLLLVSFALALVMSATAFADIFSAFVVSCFIAPDFVVS